MSDDKLSINEAIDEALHLDGDPEKISSFYDKWASSYDHDTAEVSYSGPEIGAKLLEEFQTSEGPQLDYLARILDAGCGTGLVGVALAGLGYQHIEGFDLSEAMAKKAVETGCYREVKSEIDLSRASQSYALHSFDAVLCIGVFTLGHVPPQAIGELIKLLRPQGLLVLSTRKLYYEQTDFQAVVDKLLADDQLKLLKFIEDAPYNKDGDGYYWVFRN